jgi:integrase/recombinase XerD
MNSRKSIDMKNSLSVFDKYIKSDHTREMYVYLFKRFAKWTKIDDTNGLLQLKESYLQELVEDYMMYMRKRILPNSFPPIVAALELFFSMNDKIMNWKKIRKMIPAFVKKSGRNAWQTEDIQKMLESTTSKKNKALIHLLASTACRVGAIPELRLKHVAIMPDGCKAVLMYEGTNEEYDTFLTSEASRALDVYLDERRKDGEYLDDNSPIFRASYKMGIQKVKPLSLSSITQILNRIGKDLNTRKKTGNRFNVMIIHGIRKRFATIVKLDNRIAWAVGEKLLGHKVHLDPDYFAPTRENLFKEFKKIMPALIIDQSARLRIEAQIKEEQMKKIEFQKDELIQKLQDQITENEKTRMNVQKILNHLKLEGYSESA